MTDLTTQELLARLRSGEDNFAERKSFTDKGGWLRTAVAFANSAPIGLPGILFIGAKDEGTIADGERNIEDLQKQFNGAMEAAYPPIYCLPRTVSAEDGKQCLAIIVPGSPDRPHFAGRAYIRNGPETKEASEEQFTELIAQRNSKARLDGQGAEAIRRFADGTVLDDYWKQAFSTYIAQIITRSPAYRDMISRGMKAVHEEILRIGFSDVEHAGSLLKSYGDPSHAEVTAESLVEAVTGGHIKVQINEGYFLQQMVGQIEYLTKILFALQWEILAAPLDSNFVISDYPFVLIPPRGQPSQTGFIFEGTVNYFPLTSSLCLRMAEPGYGWSYGKADKAQVRLINQNIAVNSERFVMGPSRTQLEYIINRSNATLPHSASRTTTNVMKTDRDSGLVGFTLWPRRDFFYPKI